MYRPLPECLTIKQSEIDGFGLFATRKIKANTDLGVSHFLIVNNFEPIRTAIGGFYNHSNKPNCIKIYSSEEVIMCRLVTLKDIKAGEEITVKYTLYDVEKGQDNANSK